MTELLPCPFCGGEAEEAEMPRAMIAWVYCPRCGAASGYRDTEEAAIEAWNTRSAGTCEIVEYDEAPFYVCSECGAVQPDDFTVYYCWNCGAKAVGE